MIAVSYQQAISIGGWERWVFFKVRSDLHASVEFEKLSAKHADFAGYSTRVEDDRRPTYQPNLQSILDGPAGRTSWTNHLYGPAGQTSSFYLKPWPVRIFEDFPFSLYIVAASESDEGLVFSIIC